MSHSFEAKPQQQQKQQQQQNSSNSKNSKTGTTAAGGKNRGIEGSFKENLWKIHNTTRRLEPTKRERLPSHLVLPLPGAATAAATAAAAAEGALPPVCQVLAAAAAAAAAVDGSRNATVF
ncbi:hypothetical protein ACSSS7_004984 [Eimeria intestinalis]